jgi:hypothetical protein
LQRKIRSQLPPPQGEQTLNSTLAKRGRIGNPTRQLAVREYVGGVSDGDLLLGLHTPKALNSKAQGHRAAAHLGLLSNHEIYPERVGQNLVSIPNVLFINLNVVLPTKTTKLVLERFLPMMLLLSRYVGPETLDMSRTDGERPVS